MRKTGQHALRDPRYQDEPLECDLLEYPRWSVQRMRFDLAAAAVDRSDKGAEQLEVIPEF